MRITLYSAGIIGLQSALALLEASYRVTIVAKDLPGDASPHYTSPWAGAHWRTHASAEDTEQQAWDIETYEHWLRLIEGARTVRERAELGLKIYNSFSYWDYLPKESIWWAPYVRSFVGIPAPSLPSSSMKAGVRFTSIAINPTQHMLYLRSRIHAKGGVFIRATLPSPLGTTLLSAANLVNRITHSPPEIFINATGISARTLVPDAQVHPIRGQTLLVRGEADAISTNLLSPEEGGGISYVIPRFGEGVSVLGGTKQVDDFDTQPDEQTTRAIMERCKVLAPELLGPSGEFEVLKVNVGLRPGRHGGARVEREMVDYEGREFKVVHAYGNAGAGFQNSFGVAKKVVGLVKESESVSAKL